MVAQVVLDRLPGLNRTQLEPQPQLLGEEPGNVAVDAGDSAVACRGEGREILIDGDLEAPFRPDLVEALADHIDGIRIDPRSGGARQRGGKRGERRAPGEPHCSATVSSQDRIAQIASWLSTPSKGGM